MYIVYEYFFFIAVNNYSLFKGSLRQNNVIVSTRLSHAHICTCRQAFAPGTNDHDLI